MRCGPAPVLQKIWGALALSGLEGVSPTVGCSSESHRPGSNPGPLVYRPLQFPWPSEPLASSSVTWVQSQNFNKNVQYLLHHVSLNLSIHSTIHPSIHPPIRPPMHTPMYLSAHLPIRPPTNHPPCFSMYFRACTFSLRTSACTSLTRLQFRNLIVLPLLRLSCRLASRHSDPAAAG